MSEDRLRKLAAQIIADNDADFDLVRQAVLALAAEPIEAAWAHYEKVADAEDGEWFFWRDPSAPEDMHADYVIADGGRVEGKAGCGLSFYSECQRCVFPPGFVVRQP